MGLNDWAGQGFTGRAGAEGAMIERYVTASWSCMRCTESGTGEPGPKAEDHAMETGHPTQSVYIMNYLPVPLPGTADQERTGTPPGSVRVPRPPEGA